jgi:hypothetical protein
MDPEQHDWHSTGRGGDPLLHHHAQVDPRLLTAALTDALQRSGWYDPASLQDGLYQWAATGLSVGEIRGWLAADIASPRVAAGFRELGIGPQEVRASHLGEQVSIGRLSMDDAAQAILGPRAAGGLDQLRAAFRSQQLAGTDQASRRKAGRDWWEARLQRLAGFLDDHAAPPELAAWLGERADRVLLGYRDAAVEWAGPVTIAVAQQELRRLGGVPGPGGPAGSDPLMSLIFGALAARDLTRRLGERVEAAITKPPAYLTATLGPYPDAGPAQLLWTQAALAVETFRLECEITDPQYALGHPDRPLPVSEYLRFQELNRALPRIATQLQQAALAGRGGDDHRLMAGRDGPASLAEGGRPDLADAQGHGIGALLNPDAPRPDQELGRRIGGWIEHLPGGMQAVLKALPAHERSAFSDVTLAAWWARLPEAERARVAGFPDDNLAASWDRAVQHLVRGAALDSIRNQERNRLADAAILLAEIDRRVTQRARAAAADPPAYIVNRLGPRPAAADDTGTWEDLVRDIEQYRLLTATTDPTLPLGPTPPPDASWRQCWRRELAQDLAEACFARMVYQHRIVGTPQERQQLAALAASTIDPWFGVRPDAGIVEASQGLATGELRRRVAAAVPLLADRPDNRASELRDAQLRHARLLDYQQQARAALTAAETRYAEAPLVGRATRAARAAVQEHTQALAALDRQLADVRQDLTRLEQAQAGYYEWCRQHALQVTQGQAAAQALQAREHQLLEELATYPPSYLLAELGQPPTNPDGRAAWRRGAQAIERYRAAHQVTDTDEAFGETFLTHLERRGWGEPAGQRRDQARTRELVEDARRAITDSLARELHQQLPGQDQDPPDWAVGA